METLHNHIIHKVYFEVNTTNNKTAYYIKDNIDLFCKNELFPIINELFNKYDVDSDIIRFDVLSLDLTIKNLENFNELRINLCDQIEKKIISSLGVSLEPVDDYELQDSENTKRITYDNNSGAVLLFFIERGYLPWFGKEAQIERFLQVNAWRESLQNPIFQQKLTLLFENNAVVFRRFVYQFSDEVILFVLGFYNLLFNNEASLIHKISRQIEGESRYLFFDLLYRQMVVREIDVFLLLSEFSASLKSGLIRNKGLTQQERLDEKIYLKRSGIIADIQTLLHNILPVEILNSPEFKKYEGFSEFSFEKQKEIEEEGENKPDKLETQKDLAELFEESSFFAKGEKEITIANAGILLLHPFLKHFFTAINLLNDNKTIKKELKDKAVQVLHYLGTGNENVLESNLLFEKFLCAIPLNAPVQKQSLLTDEIKEEAEHMLVEVIRNWPALKNTSVNGLRQMFFQRDGKLIKTENNYKIIVERKAQDLLLESLAWNISMFKLPWIKELILVEW